MKTLIIAAVAVVALGAAAAAENAVQQLRAQCPNPGASGAPATPPSKPAAPPTVDAILAGRFVTIDAPMYAGKVFLALTGYERRDMENKTEVLAKLQQERGDAICLVLGYVAMTAGTAERSYAGDSEALVVSNGKATTVKVTSYMDYSDKRWLWTYFTSITCR